MTAPMMVRNNESGPTVFALDKDNHVEWAGKDDPLGNDVQPVPPEYMNNVQFRRAVTRGILVVEEADEEVERVLAAHRADWENRQARAKSASAASIDEAPQNDMLMLPCVGPSGKGSGQDCGVDVPVKARAKSEAPPLCPLHKSLAGQYLAQETDKIVDGKPEVRWVKAQLGNRTKQD